MGMKLNDSGVAFRRGMSNVFSASWYSFQGMIEFPPHPFPSLGIHHGINLRNRRALTVGGTYPGRAIFDKRIGLIAAIALTGFHFHIHLAAGSTIFGMVSFS
jgi:hypothetical protein